MDPGHLLSQLRCVRHILTALGDVLPKIVNLDGQHAAALRLHALAFLRVLESLREMLCIAASCVQRVLPRACIRRIDGWHLAVSERDYARKILRLLTDDQFSHLSVAGVTLRHEVCSRSLEQHGAGDHSAPDAQHRLLWLSKVDGMLAARRQRLLELDSGRGDVPWRQDATIVLILIQRVKLELNFSQPLRPGKGPLGLVAGQVLTLLHSVVDGRQACALRLFS